MSNPDNRTAPSTEIPARPGRSSRLVTRSIVVVIVIVLTIAAFAVGVPWGRYRYNHVVLADATVKGTVTKIGARLEGRIRSIEVDAGQHVSKGDVLLRMEDRHLQAALERVRAELQCATRDLESEKLGIEQTRRRLSLELERVNAGRKKAAGELEAEQSKLTRLEKEYKSVAGLVTKGAASTNELDRITGDRDRAKGLVNAAQGVLEAAESNYQKAMNELEGVHVREARLGVMESQIAVAGAKIAVAEADLDAAVIKAPEDGRVLERIVEVGGSAKVGEPMISLWIGRAWVEAWADERDLSKIKIGSPVDISLDASPRRKFLGRVEAIGLVTDKQLQPSSVPSTLHAFVRQNAMVPVRILLEEDNSRVQLGLSVLVGIRKQSETPGAERPSVAQPSSFRSSQNRLTKVNTED